MKTLNREIQEFSFFSREVKNGKIVGNKCGRDFLWYALHFYFPTQFTNVHNNPIDIDVRGYFGVSVPAVLAWTQIQFLHVAKFLKSHQLQLLINDQEIKGYVSFVTAILFSRKKYADALAEIEASIDGNEVVGIDISLGLFGLLDHVLFVYGYDAENIYVIDTHRVASLEYTPVDENGMCFKLPKRVIASRWTIFGRVWRVRRF